MHLLGIDLGTTTVKLVIVNQNKSIVATSSDQHKADIDNLPISHDEQNVSSIVRSFVICMSSLAAKHGHLLKSVGKIGICGQMHGCVLWSSKTISNPKITLEKQFDAFLTSPPGVSNLITWQDKRATKTFTEQLRYPKAHRSLHSGFGCVTLIWLKHNQSDKLNEYDCCGTIGDLIVAILCRLSKPLITTQNAASWGFYKDEERDWDRTSLSSNGITTEMLPKIVEPLALAGTLAESVFLIPAGAKVYAAFGDSQCSVLPYLTSDSAVLNIGTAAQVSYIVQPPYCSAQNDQFPKTLAYCPFFDGKYLSMAASMNGGNVLDHFVQLVSDWVTDIVGRNVTLETTWFRINDLLSIESSKCDIGDSEAEVIAQDDFCIDPRLFGERHSELSRFSIKGMTPDSDMRLVQFFLKLIQSIVLNLQQMAPQSLFINSGIKNIILTGRAASEPYFRRAVKRAYPLLQVTSSDLTSKHSNFSAAYGCVLAIFDGI